MSEEDKNSIRQNVLEQISSGKIKQTSRAYFMVRVALFILSVILLVLGVIYIASLVFFGLRSSGAWFAPGFGLSATRSALLVVPWLLIGVVATIIVVLEVLVKHFGFVYRRPIVYSVAGILVLVLVAGYCVALTPLHRSLYQQAHGPRPPFWSVVYKSFDAVPGQSLHAGFVNELTQQRFLLNAREGADFQVRITPTTILPVEHELRVGDFVLVFGPEDENIIQAERVQYAPDEMRGFGKRPMHHHMEE